MDNPHEPFYEVQWLDENCDGHFITFSDNGKCLQDFVKAIEPISAMIAVYEMTRKTL